MRVTEEGSTTSFLITVSRIDGFEYKEGYQYRVKVLETILANPPADGHSEEYKLVEIISEQKVTPEKVP